MQANEIGRKGYMLRGNISSKNFIQIPHPQLKKTLGLTGRYIYVQMQAFEDKPFYVHFDFSIDERNNLRFALSNLFRALGTANNFVMQIPVQATGQWCVVCVDVESMLRQFELFPPEFEVHGSHVLKSIQICSTCNVRGIFTSDNLYSFSHMPTDMQFKPTGKVQKTQFTWIRVPETGGDDLAEEGG